MTENVAVQIKDLTKIYPAGRRSEPTHALSGVDVTVAEGTCLAVVGESGSGKTTLARIVVGLEDASGGTVEVAGREVSQKVNRAERKKRAREVQMVFQDPNGSLNRRMSIGSALAEVVSFHQELPRAEISGEIDRLLESVGMDPTQKKSRPDQLSGGQRQRVAIARALAARPKIIVLDEAVAALDVSVQAQVLNLLAELRKESGLTYLFITHDLAVVKQVADTVVVMQHGKVVERGDVAEVLENPTTAYTKQLLASVPRPGWKPVRQLGEHAPT